MNNIDPNKNCHEYCPIAKCCRYALGSNGLNPEECGTYFKLMDLLEDAKDIKREQENSMNCYLDDDDEEYEI